MSDEPDYSKLTRRELFEKIDSAEFNKFSDLGGDSVVFDEFNSMSFRITLEAFKLERSALKTKETECEIGGWMKHNMELHVKELILHGFSPSDHDLIGGMVELELRRLLSEQGLSGRYADLPYIPHLDAGSFSFVAQHRPEQTGSEIARRVYTC
jgi:hypothetical protein